MSWHRPERHELVDPADSALDAILAIADRLCGRLLADFLESGDVPSWIHTGGGDNGSLRDATRSYHNRKAIGIHRPRARELETARAGHDDRDGAGRRKPSPSHTEYEQAAAAAPEEPVHRGGACARLSRPRSRPAMCRQTEPTQLELDLEAIGSA